MTTKTALRDAKDDFKDAMHSVHDGYNDLREGIASAAKNAGDAGTTTIQATKHQLEEGLESVKSVATCLLDGTAKKIGQSPMTSVLVAAGIGFLSGYLLTLTRK